MRRLIVALLVVAAGFTADAATKKKETPKAQPAAPVKPGKEPSEILIGQLAKKTEGGKDAYVLTMDGGEKLAVPEAAAKRVSIHLSDFDGKKIAIACVRDETTKAIKSIRFVKTEADYKKQK